MKSLLDNWMVVDVDKLVPADWNYKEEDAFLDGQLEAGIKKRGVVQNLIIRRLDGEKFEVVNGNHRLPILRKLGLKKVMVYNLGDVSIAEAQRAAVETNEIAYHSNQLKLSALIRGMSEEIGIDQLLATMPYDKDHLQAMLDAPVFDMAEYSKNQQPPPDDTPMPTSAPGGSQAPEPGQEFAPTVIGENAGIVSVPMKKDVYAAFREQIDRINMMLVAAGSFGSKDDLKNEGNVVAIQIMTQAVKGISDSSMKKVIKNWAP